MTVELIKKEETLLLDHLEECDEADRENLKDVKILDEAEFIVTKDNLKFLVNVSLCDSDTYTLTVYDITHTKDIQDKYSLKEVACVSIDSCGNFYDSFEIYALGDILLNNRQEEVEETILNTLFGEKGIIIPF